MKCLEKDRRRRYETANSLALDLERHLHHEPVEARPPSRLYRLQKLVRRNKGAYATLAVIATALVLGVWVSTWEAIHATRAERTARHTAYVAEMNLAQRAVNDGNFGHARRLLAHYLPVAGQPERRGWEWRYLARLTRGDQSLRLKSHTNSISGLYFLDETQLLSVGWDRRASWWDLAAGRATRTLITSNYPVGLAVSPARGVAALAGGNPYDISSPVTVLDLDRRAERPAPLYFPPTDNAHLDFSPSGVLAIADLIGTGPLALWDANAGKRLAVLTEGKDEYHTLRFSPDGRQLAAATREGRIQIWEVVARSNLFSWRAHEQEGGFRITINSVAFSPDGRSLVSAGIDGKVNVWDPATGARLSQLDGHHAPVMEVVFSPDGRWLAAASLDHTLYVWETALWTPVRTFHGHSDGIRHVAWSPSGRRLATGGSDGELLLWDWPPRTGSAERIELAATANINLSVTGDTLLQLSTNTPPEVTFWDTKTLRPFAHFPTPDTNLTSSWLLPGGRLIVTGDRVGRVGLREQATGNEIRGTNAHQSEINQMAGTSDGRVVITAGAGVEGLIWELPALTLRQRFRSDWPFDARSVTTDGSCLAVGRTDGRIELFDLRQGQRRKIWPAHREAIRALAFSPDGRLLASSGWDRAGKLWDVQRAQLLRSIEGNLLTIDSLAFSPDGSRLAAGTGEGSVKLYDVPTAQEVATFKGHRRPVYAVAFVPDGTELISASFDALCVWHAPDLRDLKEVEARLSADAGNRDRK